MEYARSFQPSKSTQTYYNQSNADRCFQSYKTLQKHSAFTAMADIKKMINRKVADNLMEKHFLFETFFHKMQHL